MRMRGSPLYLLYILTVVIFIRVPVAFAQLTPDQVLQQVGNAYGGASVLGRILDSTSSGTVIFFDINGAQETFDMTVLRKGSAQVQRAIKQGAVEVREGSDGTENWQSLSGWFTPAAHGHTLSFLESQTVRSVPALLNRAAPGSVTRDKGQKGTQRVIEAQDAQGRSTEYFIDNETFRVTKLQFVTGHSIDSFNGTNSPDIEAYVFSDFRTVQGVLTPFKIERYVRGIKTEEMHFTTIKYNGTVKDDVFRP